RFYCIRAVSDTADDEFPIDFNAVRDESGRFVIHKILMRAIRNPLSTVPGLIRLGRNAQQASRALGDFFARCHF
ncbi:MAG TPA: hypothetical protein VES20_19555, partial [Bryobacteraceae bacterium]|nr:hypothetical protein [Bryobacteraceae bacterium]